MQRSYGVRGHAPRENLEMIDAIWCVLMNYFDQIKSKNYFASRVKKHTLGDAFLSYFA